MRALRAAAPAVTLAVVVASAAACFTHPVTIVVADAPPGEDCHAQCEALFGARPTSSCGRKPEARATLLCTYEAAPPSVSMTSPADEICRVACARVGFPEVEACSTRALDSGPVAVACRYAVGAH